jgi:hypothetical protein
MIAHLSSRHKKIVGNSLCRLLMWAVTKNHNIGVGSLKRSIPNIRPIFGISRFNPVDTNNPLLISAGKPTIIGIGYCY